MRVLAALDSFKGSLSSFEAGMAVKEAVLSLSPDSTVEVAPLADGGEGTVEALAMLDGSERVRVAVTGPLGAPVEAEYCILKNGCAVIEMASAAGLVLCSEKDIMSATTYGVGELILHAVLRGVRSFIIGIGGSATNDGGVGMLTALGWRFSDTAGQDIPRGARGLQSLAKINDTDVIPMLSECTFRVACDVENPLCGERGCSAVYAPQKGARPDEIALMDSWLGHYADLAESLYKSADRNARGAGAAGGMGFALLSFLNARLESGIGIVMEETGLEERIRRADVVVVGEGRLDSQTAEGKAPAGVARLAKRHGKRVIALAGGVVDHPSLNECGIDAYFPVVRGITTLERATEKSVAFENVKMTALQVFRLLL